MSSALLGKFHANWRACIDSVMDGQISSETLLDQINVSRQGFVQTLLVAVTNETAKLAYLLFDGSGKIKSKLCVFASFVFFFCAPTKVEKKKEKKLSDKSEHRRKRRKVQWNILFLFYFGLLMAPTTITEMITTTTRIVTDWVLLSLLMFAIWEFGILRRNKIIWWYCLCKVYDCLAALLSAFTRLFLFLLAYI